MTRSFVDIQNKGKEIWSKLSSRRLAADEGPSKSRMKRLKEKSKNDRLTKPGCSSLYLFATLRSSQAGYVLYKIPHNHLNNNNTNNQLVSDEFNEFTPLTPLVVFYPGDLPGNYCTLVPMGEYLYFVGEQPYDVYRIAKSDIENLTPDEHNLGSNYLKPLGTPMNSPKYKPIVFVAKDNLYVISHFHHNFSLPENYRFEMYSPSTNLWTVLGYRPNGAYGPFKSHVVLDDTVYFATYALDEGDHDESVFSYNLTHRSWKLLSTTPVDGCYFNLHPAFEPPVLPIGDMLFGGFTFFDISCNSLNYTVAASPHSSLKDSDSKSFFMRPTLAPQQNSCLESSRTRHYFDRRPGPSHYLTHLQTLNGKNVLSFVSYGYHPASGQTIALFNFFKIPGDTDRDPPVPLVEELKDAGYTPYYAKQVVSESVVIKSYFKSEFMHRKLFQISTNELHVYPGRLITCFSY